jgi:predicted nucleic acid-binding protein
VINEAHKGHRAEVGVIDFWAEAARNETPFFLASVTVGELRRGADLIRHRGDQPQAALLDQWLEQVLQNFGNRVLAIDKQIAAIALLHDLTVVTRNTDDFAPTGLAY